MGHRNRQGRDSEQAQETCADVRAWLAQNVSQSVAEATRIQYGGSVNAENAAQLAQARTSMVSLWGASLKPDGFGEILASFN